MILLGIDVGTSAVKAILVEDGERVLASASAALVTAHPHPGWSEQAPDDWWTAVEAAVAGLRQAAPTAFSGLTAIGLSGQMHGAVVLDAADDVIRPAILWNDGRATAECAALEAAVPDLGRLAGVVAMAGLTAPKILWLCRHEPENFARIRALLLPKDHVRLTLTGEKATDMCDAAGALLLDEAARRWSGRIADAAGLPRTALPTLLEGPAVSGELRPEIRAAWGLRQRVIVAAGAGDAAAGAIGIGAVEEGDSFVSLGTSAQYFVTRDRYEPKPERLIHAFAHGLPGRWFEMAAMLNGATCLAWIAGVLGEADIGALVARVEARGGGPSPVTFLPYLSGERTPHNDPDVRGAFAGLSAETGREDLVRAVLEGVAFSLAEAQAVLGITSTAPLPVVGGAARSRFWLKIIASALGRPVLLYAGADKGPAFGAARLARIAASGEDVGAVCLTPDIEETIAPDPGLAHAYGERLATYRALYPAVRPSRAPRADRPPAARR